ncbi:MAG: LicD family protein [Halomonas sp.]|nr:LicD family protein [Halomonas sp.]MDP3535934.1 LicD family protein [Halomonas sp.]
MSKRHDPLANYKERADKLRRKGDIKKAIVTLENGLKVNRHSAELHYLIARLYKEDKEDGKAAEHYQLAIDAEAEYVPALLELGQMHLKKGSKNKALTMITAAYEKSPNLAATNAAYASVLHQHGHLTEAIEHHRTALKMQAGAPSQDKDIQLRDDFNQPETEKLMWDTLARLAEGGVHAFAFYGTLLGVVREGGLLPFDKDLDFGLPYSEMKRADKIMKRNGWVSANQATPFFNPVAYYHTDKKATVDLFGMTVEKDGTAISGFWMPGIPKEWNQISEYAPVELEKIESPEGERVWHAKDPEALLETIYGPEWKIPDGYFDTVIAAKNLRGFSPITQCFALPRIYSNIEKGNIKKAAALLSATLKGMPGDELLLDIKRNLLTHDDAKLFLEGA